MVKDVPLLVSRYNVYVILIFSGHVGTIIDKKFGIFRRVSRVNRDVYVGNCSLHLVKISNGF